MPSKHRNKPDKQRKRAPKEKRAAGEAFDDIEQEIVSADESAAAAVPASASPEKPAPVGRKKTRSGKEIERRASFHAFKAPEQA